MRIFAFRGSHVKSGRRRRRTNDGGSENDSRTGSIRNEAL